MSSNTPGSNRNQDSEIASNTSQIVLRKRPATNAQANKSETTVASTSIAPGHSTAKLRKINVTGSKPEEALSVPASLPSASTPGSSSPSCDTDSPTSPASSSSKTSVPKLNLKNELKHLKTFYQDPNDGRLTRSRTKAISGLTKQPSPSVPSGPSSTSGPSSSSQRSFFAQGKDKIAKLRSRRSDRETKKEKAGEKRDEVTSSQETKMSEGPSSSSAQLFEPMSSSRQGYMIDINPPGFRRPDRYSPQPVALPAHLLGNHHGNGLIPRMVNPHHRNSSFLGNLVPRMQHLLAGNGGAILGHPIHMQSNVSTTESQIGDLKPDNEVQTPPAVIIQPPSNIFDELGFTMDEAFLQQQQALYAQLSGTIRSDAETFRLQQEALAKLGINETDNQSAPNNTETSPSGSENTPPPNPSQPQSATTYGRYSSMMEGLRSTNDIRQIEAANELAELLLMGNEESLPNLPIREIVQLLNTLMQKENNLELTLTAVRCITNMQEAIPRAMPILAEAVPTLLQKLKHITCIDIAEQTLVALEVLSRRNAKTILHAGGFADAVMHVDFFSMPSQRLVYQIAANCATHINGNSDFSLVRTCLSELVQKITFDDKRCCESICIFFYRLIDNYRNVPERLRDIAGKNFEFLSKIQQLFMIQPTTINSDTFINLLRSVRIMCLKCPDVVNALIDMEFGRTLQFLLVGSQCDDAVFDITHRPPQHMREIVCSVIELLPPLPNIDLFEISATTVQYMTATLPNSLGSNVPVAQSEDFIFVSWQYETEEGSMTNFSQESSSYLESKRSKNTIEVFVGDDRCSVDFVEMRYTNHNTGFAGRLDRIITSLPKGNEKNAVHFINREKHNERLIDLIRLLFPILVEIGSATSCSYLHYEATRAMIRMIYAVESEKELKSILYNLPLANYIASTLGSNKGEAVAVSAFQFIHVLLDKLPRLYVPLFESQGVFHMINRYIQPFDEKAPQSDVVTASTQEESIPNDSQSGMSSANLAPVSVDRSNSSDSSSSSSLSSTRSSVRSSASPVTSVVSRQSTDSPSTVYSISPPYPQRLTALDPEEIAMMAPQEASRIAYANEILNSIHQEVNMAMQAGSQAHTLCATYRAACKNRIAKWLSTEGQYIISNYHENDDYDVDQTVVNELCRIAVNLDDKHDVGIEPLEALKKIMTENDISSFQLDNSNVIYNLSVYLADSCENRKPERSCRIKRFMEVFMGFKENNLRPTNLDSDCFAPFERLVSKIVYSIGQMEQFQIKITNLSGIIADNGTSTSSSGNGTVLRGSQALRFFQTHQIRCNLKRHPSCKKLREWRHGRGSIKVDPFTAVSAIERYLIDRGIGNNLASESSSENEDGSEDDPDIASGESSTPVPFTGRVEILINDRVVPSDLSIIQAIRQFSLSQDEEAESIPPAVWVHAHTLYFRTAPADSSDSSGSPSDVSKRRKSGPRKSVNKSKPQFYTTGQLPSPKNPLEPFLNLTLPNAFSDPCYHSCLLLRILYGLNKYWWTLFDCSWPTTHQPILALSAFYSSKMNSKVQRQLSDFLSVATQEVPKWTTNLVQTVPFMFSFGVRRHFLYCTAFGRDRALMHLIAEANHENEGESTNRLTRLERRKVTVHRENIYDDAVSTFYQMDKSKAQLEVNFDGEVGTGYGPTLEFYSAISLELQKHSRGLWTGNARALNLRDDTGIENYTVADNGLYPLPINKLNKHVKHENRNKHFEFMGRLLAQALLDSRMLDIPLSSVFFKWILNEEDTISAFDMEMLDKTFYNSLRQILMTTDPHDLLSLEQNFTMPGDESFELIKGGKNTQVTIENVKQFVELVVYWRLIEGVREEMMAFRQGFYMVIDPAVLTIFSCEEMEELFCGCSERSVDNDRIWSKTALHQALRPDHGYTHDSQQINWLVDMLHSFSLEDRRKFLQFCTGSPRLPVGGFRSLSPPLTVVRKTASYGNVDGELPSAMTCYNFLKIPPYTSYETFVERFQVALQFIYSFHLT